MIPQPTQSGEVRREAGLAPPQPPASRWRHFFRLATSYWTSPDWKFAWFALIVLIAFQFGGAYIFLAANRWEQNFFDSIERRDIARFSALFFVFLGIMAMQIGQIIVQGWISKLLSIRWRSFLTDRYIDRWMAQNRYAEIERLRMIDNPDQRIAQDLAILTNTVGGALTLTLSSIGATVTTVTFVFVLLETAEPIRFTAFGTAIVIPGSTVWYALAYALIGSVIIARIGAPYIRANMGQQHREADFRAGLIHVRRNAGQIGLAGAVGVERASLSQSFAEVRRNFRTIILTSLGLSATQSVYERIGTVLPLFLLVPRYLAGAISFGQVMGARDAFRQLVTQLSFFVQSYPQIGALVATVNRIKGLDDAIDDARPAGIAVAAGTPTGVALVTAGLALRRPHGEPLVHVGDWHVRAGERWAVRGDSGAGKSTLVRALAGLWPEGEGSIALAADTTAMFVPQRLYLPLGTLKAAICFPDRGEAHDDAAIVALLDRVRLGHLADDLHALRMWQDELSPGEQQRVALARILLHRPALLVLDEATAALDAGNARHFHDCIAADLPHATVVSVVHDETLVDWHSHVLAIDDGRATSHPLPIQE